ncbi:MAG: class I SAM-dependent methyltransferase [Ignavibacteria bacterium]|nr:class I SAM-dependent methyltransferase [Ignavibacteria bacterium]
MEFSFDDFKVRARDKELSKWEKIGFPDDYRKLNEKFIFEDIVSKCNLTDKGKKHILDIGCGCSNLVNYLIKFCEKKKYNLDLIDSLEMLDNIKILNNRKFKNIQKLPGKFPEIENLKNYFEKYDVIIIYSVIQYVFLYQNLYYFLHKSLDLLKPGGVILIGDIPNNSKRKRFINSPEGLKFNKNIKSKSKYKLINHEDFERIDDSVIFSILQRYRNFNCETYLLPQNHNLPFSNRREDILIIKR